MFLGLWGYTLWGRKWLDGPRDLNSPTGGDYFILRKLTLGDLLSPSVNTKRKPQINIKFYNFTPRIYPQEKTTLLIYINTFI